MVNVTFIDVSSAQARESPFCMRKLMCGDEKYTWKPGNLDGENHARGITAIVTQPLFTSHTPNKMTPPPNTEATVIGSPKIKNATTIAINGSI